jgi:hypothetical protein
MNSEVVNCADQVGRHTDPSKTAKAQFVECGKETGKEYHIQSLANSAALPALGNIHIRGLEDRPLREL